jgi:hypothetical protein
MSNLMRPHAIDADTDTDIDIDIDTDIDNDNDNDKKIHETRKSDTFLKKKLEKVLKIKKKRKNRKPGNRRFK